jgi:Spy/CpxP family protein refolding chaperone
VPANGGDSCGTAALADGRVEMLELQAQAKRVVELMKEIKPLLTPEAHAKMTELFCEVTA